MPFLDGFNAIWEGLGAILKGFNAIWESLNPIFSDLQVIWKGLDAKKQQFNAWEGFGSLGGRQKCHF